MPDSWSKHGDKTQKRSTSRDRALAAIAGRQEGLIADEQLLALGFTREDVRTRIARGQLHRIHLGVYAVGHTKLTPHARLFAALMTCGPTSFLSHRTAAAVSGLRSLTTREIHVSVPDSRLRPREGLVIHQVAAPHPADVTVRDGLRVSSVARLLFELAPLETKQELDRLITQAARRSLLDVQAIEDVLVRHHRRPGVAKLKTALHDYRPRPDRKSELERAFDRLIAGTDIPDPLRNVVIDGWEIDCYWPHARLAVELDGRPYHSAVRDSEKDKLKDAKLLRQRINVMRITDRRMSLEPAAVLEDVRSLTT